MLIKLGVLNGDNGIDQVARQLIVRNCLTILDVDLSEDFAVSVENHAGGFHLLELRQIVSRSLVSQPRGQGGKKSRHCNQGDHDYDCGQIKSGLRVPGPAVTVRRRRHQKRDGHAGTGKDKSTSVGILGAIQGEIQRRNVITGDPELIERIRAEISAQGPRSFARFMEFALYEPQHGYYSSGRAVIGRRGDFFTNVSVGPLFGQLLAWQFIEVWEKLGRPQKFTIVEHGAHEGAFATDVLTAVNRSLPECFNAIHYVIAEPFSVWRDRQQEKLASFRDKARWVESINELEPFVGIHFSNELFDALPVHLVVSLATKNGAVVWNERLVSMSGNDFELVPAPIPDSHLEIALNRLPLLPAGVQTEINLAAPKLVREIATKLARGVILTIDYGVSRSEFYSPHRRQGSLQIRSGHRKLSSPFEQIGQADISTHEEWTSLAEAGQEAGAVALAFTDQHHFFTGIISGCRTAQKEFGASSKRALQTLLHPELLGRNFQVLALAKNFPESLSGFRFARDVRGELGMEVERSRPS